MFSPTTERRFPSFDLSSAMCTKIGIKTLGLSLLALRGTHMPHFNVHCAGSVSPESRG